MPHTDRHLVTELRKVNNTVAGEGHKKYLLKYSREMKRLMLHPSSGHDESPQRSWFLTADICSLAILKVSAGLCSSLDSGQNPSWILSASYGQSLPSSSCRATTAVSAFVVSWRSSCILSHHLMKTLAMSIKVHPDDITST